MYKYLIVNILLLLFFSSGIAFPQGGSNYSLWGIGDIYNNSSAFYEALGGTSIAFPSENTLNTRNPALWSQVTKTRLITGYRFNQNYIVSDESNLYQNNGKLDGVHMLFSVDTSMGLSLGLAVIPYSSVNYLVRKTQENIIDGNEVNYFTEYQGSGGITKALIGGSIKLFDKLAVGGYGFANFGFTKNNTITSSFGAMSYPSSTQGYDYYNGSGFNIGLLVTPIHNLSIGIFYEKYSDIKTNCEVTYSVYSDPLYGGIVNDTTLVGDKYSIAMPDAFGIGASYKMGKFIVGADAHFQDFSSFDYNGGTNAEFVNSGKYSIGVSRIGNRAYYAPYLDKVTYNFGLGYKQLYYQIAGQDITESYFSLGFEFPIVGSAVIDAAMSIGTRGTTSAGLVQEYFGRLMIDINLGETWFVPFRRE